MMVPDGAEIERLRQVATAADAARVEAEWQHLQARVKAVADDEIPDPNAWRRAVRWVLVQSFGDTTKFMLDADFHHRVVAAEQMIDRLRELDR